MIAKVTGTTIARRALPEACGGLQRLVDQGRPVKGAILWEHPVMLYSYVKPDRLLNALPALREFLHRMGRETRQGEVALEFAGRFYRITQFERKRKERDND